MNRSLLYILPLFLCSYACSMSLPLDKDLDIIKTIREMSDQPKHKDAVKKVKELLAAGASLRAKDEKLGDTALHWAVFANNEEMARFLIGNIG